MRLLTLVTAAMVVPLFSCAVLSAQKVPAKPRQNATIEIGQSVSHVNKILKDRGIKNRGHLALDTRNPDIDHFSFDIDPQASYAVIFYSKSSNAVTGVEVAFFPEGNHAKSTRIEVPAKSVIFREDGGYTVAFLPPNAGNDC